MLVSCFAARAKDVLRWYEGTGGGANVAPFELLTRPNLEDLPLPCPFEDAFFSVQIRAINFVTP